jgi:hypothetical protein
MSRNGVEGQQGGKKKFVELHGKYETDEKIGHVTGSA